jgi:ligand-binding sensor protein/AraC-like DNA-binding protein
MPILTKGLTNIQQIVNPAKFQKIQDDISLATELAIITVDYMGVPVTAHSNCSEFCKRVRSSEKYRHYCEKCDSRGGLESVRIRKPFIYFCHAGLIDFAIPIIIDNLYLGAFMAGQVILENEDSNNKLEHILSGTDNSIDFANDASLEQSYKLLPVMRMDKITALANMLFHIGNYCIEEAVLKASIARLNSDRKLMELHKTRDTVYIEHNKTNSSSDNFKNSSSKILQPALDYIKGHTDEKISLTKMSALCNISTSYFSKLFARENLGSLSDYVNHVKLAQAKKLLISTDYPIRSIADKLGFDDCGYFIKVFKNEAGKTPSEFRKSYCAE